MKHLKSIIIFGFLISSISINHLAYANIAILATSKLTKWIGKLPKHIIFKTISKISFKELKFLTKIERIDFLLEKAYLEGRINPAYIYRLRIIYSKIPYGDRFLYLCLKDKNCNPLKFADKANSWVYQYIIRNYPEIQSFRDLNKIIGDFSERLIIKFFEKNGWKCINGKYRGNNGFDGLCVKTNWWGSIEDILILESKAENSLLGEAKCGKQMSKSCIISTLEVLKHNTNQERNWLQKLFSKNEYQEILEMVKRNKYRKRLIRVKSTQEGLKIEIYKIEDNGLKNVRTIKENVINVNLKKPITKQDKYIKSIAEEALKETLEKYTQP
jgi:hypothetical protein